MTTSIRANALACALLTTTALASPAFAQSAGAPSVYRNVDGNGVDLTDGSFNFTIVEGSIGTGESRLAMVRTNGRAGWTDELPGRLQRSLFTSNNHIAFTFGNRSEDFVLTGGVWTPEKADGATLAGSSSSYTYRSADGTEVRYGIPDDVFITGTVGGNGIQFCVDDSSGQCELLPLSIKAPDGRRTDFHWTVAKACDDVSIGGTCNYFPRLGSVGNESAYLIKIRYALDAYDEFQGPATDWFRRTGAKFVNQAVEYCDPTALNCDDLIQNWPTISYSEPAAGVLETTDTAGRIWRFASTSSTFSIRRPGSATDDVTVTRDTSGKVTQVAADGITTNYAFSDSGSTRTATVTNALNQQTVVTSDLTIGRPISVKDALNRTTSFQYDANGRLTRTTEPEGNYVQYTLDARGNVTQTQAVTKPGSPLAAITASAVYPSSCTNPVTCNKPVSTTDARQKVTDYSYDPTHGGLLSVTAPAAPNGVRPQTRFGYTAATPPAGTGPVHLLTATSACRTQASCAGTADETKTNIAYNSANLLPVSVSSGAGDGSLTATQTMSYDSIGNLLTVDGPLAGTADTVRYRYNAAREQVGTISPDPDGAGALKHRAVRTTIDARGLVTRVETGTVSSQSDADWSAFAPIEAAETGYDADRRLVTQKLVAGGTVHALTQTGYDALGRVECQAVRMNPSAFGSLPSSACSLGTQGSFGPDRISKTVYDVTGQVTQVRSALGTASEAADATATYTLNGQVQTLTDAENNRTTYEHDGHDRLSKTFYPVPTKGANASSTTDYEFVGYDAGSNLSWFRNRAGEVIVFSYDNLSRLSLKELPGIEPDVSYSYDLVGRLTSASQPGHELTFTYDALGRITGETGPHGTVGSAYDLAGRRTRITHADGFYIDQSYLLTGEMTRITENGNPFSSLATFAYDDLGRRTSLTRGNGTSTSYSYDPVSRLSQLVQNPAGTTNDLTLGFGYNPASQIVSNTRSNDGYSFQPAAESATSPANGLNQLTSLAGSSITHDAKGNMTTDPTTGYSLGYSSENLLATVSGSGWSRTLTSDPLMRLYQPASVKMGYDGLTRIAEYSAADVQTMRFVHGPGIDEPLVEYSGTGLATRRYLHADERGSIIASTDDAGNVAQIGLYDEFGWVQSFASRYAFAGQPWESLSQLSYNRARMYNPRLGRFMQPDPIGYDDGMNMYNYVGSDPVNKVDPLGLQACITENNFPGTRRGGVCVENPIVVTAPTLGGVGGAGGGGGGLFGGACNSGMILSVGFQQSCDESGGGSSSSAPCFIPIECANPRPRNGPSGKTQPRKSIPKPCSVDNRTTLGAVRTVAGAVATGADVAAVLFGAGAAATAPTVAGGLTLGVLAGVSKGISVTATIVEGVAAGFQRDGRGVVSAAGSLVGGIAGRTGSRALRSVHGVGGRYGNVGDDAAGAAAGSASSAAACIRGR